MPKKDDGKECRTDATLGACFPRSSKCRRYLRRRFRYDSRRLRFLRGGDIPDADTHYLLLLAMCQEHEFHDRAFHTCLMDLYMAAALGVERPRALGHAEDAMLRIWQSLPLVVGGMMKAPLRVAQFASNPSMAGWAHTQLRQFPRLQQALREELERRDEREKSTPEELRERLPSAVWEAWRSQLLWCSNNANIAWMIPS